MRRFRARPTGSSQRPICSTTAVTRSRTAIERLESRQLLAAVPFGEQELIDDLDAEGLRKNVAYHAANPTQNMSIVVGGGMGEVFTLDPDEHRRMVEAAVVGAQGRFPVIAGVTGGYKPALNLAGKIIRGALKRTGGFDSRSISF